MSVTGRTRPVADDQPAELIPAIGYRRVSIGREEMISPEIQKSAINNWARQNGRRIIGWVDDLDDTGRNFKRKITTAIDRIEDGEAAEIVVYRYDRWGRNAVESLANVHRVESVGGSVVSATEPLDPETAIGRYNRTNAFGLAELQSDIISENWKAVMANRVSRQLTPSGSPRFGYRRVGRVPDTFYNPSSRVRRRYRVDPDDPDERYEPDPETAPVLAEIYGRYISGWGYGRIAVWLNECGVLNTRGAPWSDVTVRNVLDAGFGAGFLHVHAGHCKCRNRGSCRNRVRAPGKHEPVISEEMWQAFLAARDLRARTPSRTLSSVLPLRGLVFCGHCGWAMYAQTAKGIRGYMYRCKRWHHYRDCDGPFPLRSVVEAAVREKIAEWAEISEAKAVAKARDTSRATADAERARAERDLAKTDTALRRLAVQKAVDGDKIPTEVYDGARDELLARRDALQERVRQTQGQAQANAADFLPVSQSLLTEWDTITPAQLQRLLATMIRRVEVSRSGPAPRRGIRTGSDHENIPGKTLGELLSQPDEAAPYLRAMRVRASVSGYDLAGAIGWPQSKVSRMETGKQKASAADIETWVRTCEQMADSRPAGGYEVKVIPVWEASDPA
jgi:site-specific DNA recombinase